MSRLTGQLVHRVIPVVLVVLLMWFLRTSDRGLAGEGLQSTTIALGFLLVGAFIGGKMSAGIQLPRITGYLAVGLIVGPSVTGLLTEDMLAGAKAVEGLAVALIALTAGGEIRIEWVKKQARRLVLITGSELLTVAIAIMGVVLLARSALPFMPDDSFGDALVIAFVFGAIAVANSPTVTIAVIAENEAEGPVSRTALGVTVLKDVCVIVLFAVAMTVARNALGDGGGTSLGLTLARELGGSMGVGLLFGMGISLFLLAVDRETPLFILIACLGMWQVSDWLHLENLLVALTAGFWVENFSRARGEVLIHNIERLSLPVYALFFATAGAKVDLQVLAELWPFALMISGARAAAVWGGTRLGAELAGVEPEVKRYVWLAFISQAGVSLALSAIVARNFPTWGPEVQAIIIAMIAMHEFIGPVGLQYALRRSGEVGAARRGSDEKRGSPDEEPQAAS